MKAAVEKIHSECVKKDQPEIRIGDSVRVDILIVEGDKERVQAFTGTVIARNGRGVGDTITVRRVAYGQGVERVLPLNSPRIAKIEVLRHGRVRRAKLYYLRGQVGRAAKVEDVRVS